MNTKAFSFNSKAKYLSFGHFKEKRLKNDLIHQQIAVDDKGGHFRVEFPDIFADYQNPALTGDVDVSNKAYHNWKSAPFAWWQCQLNFAI